ncbi:putative P-loop containing nucleoside triphosphate hydrolase [Medicago truncatula]|uniref:Putative P-loop containing nucleoside triphosphate hydrolase n=1 Tax=Medicago truncatula TaxID=3880 RepID=A0A396I0D0_MEDTR|nr:putative P-loop containing nucleoside triphosphate hydrolase [Medicago truncatula]
MTGIGKTTIAQSIFNQISPYFEYNYFLNNIGTVWERNGGQVSLQEKFLFDIRKGTKRVLLVLENVDKLEQLNALCGSRKWFAPGSKIIITTRDRHLLKEHGVDHIYRVKELDKSESLDLLNCSAFSQTTRPPEDFVDLSRQRVAYSRGWPLALKALGRFLHGKKVLEWKGILSSIEKFSIPDPRLLNALEKSFSDLSDNEKQIFLDIAYFFIGMNQNDVLQTLNKSTQYAALQICLLEDKI